SDERWRCASRVPVSPAIAPLTRWVSRWRMIPACSPALRESASPCLLRRRMWNRRGIECCSFQLCPLRDALERDLTHCKGAAEGACNEAATLRLRRTHDYGGNMPREELKDRQQQETEEQTLDL